MPSTFAIRPFGEQYNGPDTRYRTLPPVNASTFKVGAVVFLTDDGEIQEGAANPTKIFGVATAAANAYAWQADTHEIVKPAIPVALADEEFRGTLKGTFATNMIGGNYDIERDSTSGYWVVKSTSQGNARVTVLSVDTVATNTDGEIVEIEAGDIDVPCTFMFLPANRQVN